MLNQKAGTSEKTGNFLSDARKRAAKSNKIVDFGTLQMERDKSGINFNLNSSADIDVDQIAA